MRWRSCSRYEVLKALKGFALFICLILAVLTSSNSVFVSPSHAVSVTKPQPLITEVQQPSGSYHYEELVHTSLQVFNPNPLPVRVKMVWQLYRESQEISETQEVSVLCQPMQTTQIDYPFLLSAKLAPGHYYTGLELFALEDGHQQSIGRHYGGVGFWLFANTVDVKSLEGWRVSDKQLGRTQFKPQNVAYSEGLMTLSIPQGTQNGAEIWSSDHQSYGVYAVRMKLPNAPGSITGFFLYEPPDYAHEIDIELYNQQYSQLMMTTYADAGKQNAVQIKLPFDPTSGFHEYLIDYQSKGLSFYADGQWQQTWIKGYSHTPMRLMLNVWYPEWLEGPAADETKKLYVEWIRYN